MQEVRWYTLIVIFSFPMFVGMVSPALGASFSLAVLLLSIKFGRASRLYLAVLAIFFSSVVISSRAIGVSNADDFWSGYWPLYQEISAGNLDKIFQYGDGFEPALGLMFLIISSVTEHVSPRQLIFILVFLNQLLLLLWVEFLLPKHSKIARLNHQLCMSLVLFFFSTFLASQVVRQSFASVFLVIALFSGGRVWPTLGVIIGAAFHLTTVPIFFLIRIALFAPYLAGASLCMMGIVIYLDALGIVYTLLDYLGGGGLGYSKIVFYEESNATSIWSSGLVFLLQLFIVMLLYLRRKGSLEYREMRLIYFIFTILFFALLPLPFASLRSTLVVNSIAFGYFLLVAIPTRYMSLAKIAIVVLITYTTLRCFFQSDDNPFELWVGYDSAGVPGYFLEKLFFGR